MIKEDKSSKIVKEVHKRGVTKSNKHKGKKKEKEYGGFGKKIILSDLIKPFIITTLFILAYIAYASLILQVGNKLVNGDFHDFSNAHYTSYEYEVGHDGVEIDYVVFSISNMWFAIPLYSLLFITAFALLPIIIALSFAIAYKLFSVVLHIILIIIVSTIKIVSLGKINLENLDETLFWLDAYLSGEDCFEEMFEKLFTGEYMPLRGKVSSRARYTLLRKLGGKND